MDPNPPTCYPHNKKQNRFIQTKRYNTIYCCPGITSTYRFFPLAFLPAPGVDFLLTFAPGGPRRSSIGSPLFPIAVGGRLGGPLPGGFEADGGGGGGPVVEGVGDPSVCNAIGLGLLPGSGGGAESIPGVPGVVGVVGVIGVMYGVGALGGSE